MQKERKLCCGKITQKVWEVRDELDYLGMAGADIAACGFILESQNQSDGSCCREIWAGQAQRVFNLHLTQHCT